MLWMALKYRSGVKSWLAAQRKSVLETASQSGNPINKDEIGLFLSYSYTRVPPSSTNSQSMS